MDFLLKLIRAFIIGGALCVIAQIFIDKTRLTPARILVAYVTMGVILGGAGVYGYLVDLPDAARRFRLRDSDIRFRRALKRPLTKAVLSAR